MPNTVNRYFNVPNTGDLVGTWGTSAINPNFNSIDGALGGVATIALSSPTTITLTLPAGASFTPGAGPSQSENAVLKFAGTLTGNSIIKFTMPGYYIVHNTCGSAASFSIQLSPASGVGNSIGAPPGRKAYVFFDGTDMDYVDMPEVGSALDLHTNTTGMPPWMNVCTVRPYLIKDGSVYNASAYTALAQVLGSTFGGNGVTTFGLPDERSRARIGLDTLSVATGTFAGRVTAVGSGISGTTMGSVGGDQLMQQHLHSITDPGHRHPLTPPVTGISGVGAGVGVTQSVAPVSQTDNATTSISINNAGSGGSQNMPPSIVSFLPLIKT